MTFRLIKQKNKIVSFLSDILDKLPSKNDEEGDGKNISMTKKSRARIYGAPLKIL